MELEIREMWKDDLPGIIEIEDASFPRPWSCRAFLREIEENPYALYLTGLFADRVVGYIGGWIVIDELHITNLAVRERFRRRGIGRKLLEELEACSFEQGVVKATLEVRVSNIGARKLYGEAGYEEAGRRRNYYQDNGEDAVIMWKDFKKGTGD
ncbi:MAG: ribosomal protein S18-alanine N-acetyltransferase [Halanaerobiaceae bacterium]